MVDIKDGQSKFSVVQFLSLHSQEQDIQWPIADNSIRGTHRCSVYVRRIQTPRIVQTYTLLYGNTCGQELNCPDRSHVLFLFSKFLGAKYRK